VRSLKFKYDHKKDLKLKQILDKHERTVLLLALDALQRELDQFLDKKTEYGTFSLRATDIEPLKEYLRYG